MINYIFNILSPEMITMGLVSLAFLILLAARSPHFVMALSFTAAAFSGKLNFFFPISVSATIAIFSLAAVIGAFFRGYKFHLGRIELCFLLLTLVMTFSLRYSPSPVYGQEKLILFSFCVAPVVVFMPNIIRTMAQLRLVICIIGMTVFLCLIIGMVFRQYTGFVGRWGVHGPIAGGQLSGLLFMLSFILYGHAKNIFPKILMILLGIFSLYLSLLTGTRSVVLAISFSVVFCFWFQHPGFLRYMSSRPLKIYLGLCFIVLAVLFTSTVLKKVLSEQVFSRYSSFESFLAIDESGYPRSRALSFSTAVNCFVEHPFIGVGVGGYKEYYKHFGSVSKLYHSRSPVYPHNVFLEFASEQGLAGLLIFSYIIFLSCKMILAIRRFYLFYCRDVVIVLIACLFVYGFCVAQTSLDLPRMIYLWWGLAMLIALHRLTERNGQSLSSGVNLCQK
jgi:O-antigen ligase